jgi:hypothetical protein
MADNGQAAAALAEIKAALVPVTTAASMSGAFAGQAALRALAAVDAALKHHTRVRLYGNAATEEEPDACPHDPDDDRWHFEDPDGGEWLCQGKPEGVVCSCTESPDGERLPWPCDEVTGILAALTGEGNGR